MTLQVGRRITNVGLGFLPIGKREKKHRVLNGK